MKIRLFGTTTIAAALAFAAPAIAQTPIKIGFISTFSGPQAAIGEDMRRSVELAKEHLGGKMGGKPFEIIYEDDQFKPDVGKQKSEKLVQQDKVNFVTGYIWSNVLLASLKTVTDEGDTILISSNAGPSQIAGELCNKNFFSTSWNNDQTPMAMGQYLQEKGVKSLYLMAGNYAAGKDMLAGVKRTFKGEIIGEDLTKWPDQLDFSAELAKIRAAKPDGIFIFYPGAHGVQFLHAVRARRVSRARSRSTRCSRSTRSRCRSRRSWRLAPWAPRNGSTTCPTSRTRSTSPTSRRSTASIRPTTARRATIRSC